MDTCDVNTTVAMATNLSELWIDQVTRHASLVDSNKLCTAAVC